MALTWITGASSGIGAALALELTRRGETVVASARRGDELAALAARAEGLPGRILAEPLDVTDDAAVAATVARIEAAHGQIDRAVLNVGTYVPDGIADGWSVATIRKHYAINIDGTLSCLDALVPRFVARRAGHLAIVSSVAGYRGLPRAFGYSSSKAALIALAETARLELAPYGVKVQIVNPGFVRTPLTDRNDFAMPMLMEVDAAARAFADGLDRNGFEIAFPALFCWLARRLSGLPYFLYFRLVGLTNRHRPS